MTVPDTHQQLAATPLFHDLDAAEIDAVLRLMEFEGFRAGANILDEGLSYQSLWVIVTGRCEVVKNGSNSHPSRLAVLEPGAVFGEMSFFDPLPHSASVRCLTDVSTMRLMRAAYDRLRETTPRAADKIARNMVRILSERLRRMDDWTCELVQVNGSPKQQDEWEEFRAKLYAGLEI